MRHLVLVLFFLTACGSSDHVVSKKWEFAAECVSINDGASVFIEGVGSRNEEPKICIDGSSALAILPKVRVAPYLNGMADVDFYCDQASARSFYKSHAGKVIYLVSSGKAYWSARVPDSVGEDAHCSIRYLSSVSDATALCEEYAVFFGFDSAQCHEACGKNDSQKSACILPLGKP